MIKEFNLPPDGIERYTAGFLDLCAANGYTYENFDAAFRNCVRKDWPGLRINGAMKSKTRSLIDVMDEADKTRQQETVKH